jgi:hypothetical protein
MACLVDLKEYFGDLQKRTSQPILHYGAYPPSVPLPKYAPPRALHMAPAKAVSPDK